MYQQTCAVAPMSTQIKNSYRRSNSRLPRRSRSFDSSLSDCWWEAAVSTKLPVEERASQGWTWNPTAQYAFIYMKARSTTDQSASIRVRRELPCGDRFCSQGDVFFMILAFLFLVDSFVSAGCHFHAFRGSIRF